MNELRREPLLGRWVTVLKESVGPDGYSRHGDIPPGVCALCLGERNDLPVLFQSGETDTGIPLVKVLHRESGIFSIEGDLGRRGVGMYDRMNSVGASEIVIESPHHERPAEDMGADKKLQVVPFENIQKEMESAKHVLFF